MVWVDWSKEVRVPYLVRQGQEPHKREELITTDLENLRSEARAIIGEFNPRFEDATGRKMTTSRRNTGKGGSEHKQGRSVN